MIVPVLFLFASILPPSIDDWKRTETAAPELPLPAVAKEYGLQESDSASYELGKKTFKIAIFRLKDTTGAVALEQSLQQTGKVFRHQNYVFQTLDGTAPRGALDAFLIPNLPKIDRSANPNLISYLPRKHRVAGSERFILGPESLRAFEGRIPVPAAGFDFAGEIQLARYSVPTGEAVLALFRYPNNLIARQQLDALQKAIPSGAITRQGPLVTLVLPGDPGQPLKPETAQSLAVLIQYKASIMMDKAPPKPQPNPGEMLVGIFSLAGILMGLCLFLGLLFAFLRIYGRRWSGKPEEAAMTTLNI